MRSMTCLYFELWAVADLNSLNSAPIAEFKEIHVRSPDAEYLYTASKFSVLLITRRFSILRASSRLTSNDERCGFCNELQALT